MQAPQLPERCDTCPFFMQTFTQELKRKTEHGLRSVEVLTGICGAMRLSEIRVHVPRHETTHRRAGDSSCYFSIPPGSIVAAKVSWLVERRRTAAAASVNR